MTNLAIQGHDTRSKEVIEILEMLGASNPEGYEGSRDWWYYSIEDNKIIQACGYYWDDDFTIFTLEEFLEKFPYKIGDIVEYSYAIGHAISTIKTMSWVNDSIVYTMDNGDNRLSQDLKLYKQETMEEQIKIDIPKGYKFSGVDNQQIVFEKVKPKYPKDYDECCKVLDWNRRDYDRVGYKSELLCKLQVLLLCRAAYWKIAGEQMGLDKPWEPDWSTEGEIKYVIEVYRNNVRKNSQGYSNTILAFPTPEMRDAFFENFGYLIEICKELL